MTAEHSTAGVVERLSQELLTRGWRMATAESCTGGLVAGACTDRAGSSDWFERGWVTYSNQAKTDELGVPIDLIAEHGAVSESVALAMALGAQRTAQVQAAVAVTGIAGPGGAVPGKPVGTVWIAWAVASACGMPQAGAQRLLLAGDRQAVRRQTVQHALEILCRQVTRNAAPASEGGGAATR